MRLLTSSFPSRCTSVAIAVAGPLRLILFYPERKKKWHPGPEIFSVVWIGSSPERQEGNRGARKSVYQNDLGWIVGIVVGKGVYFPPFLITRDLSDQLFLSYQLSLVGFSGVAIGGRLLGNKRLFLICPAAAAITIVTIAQSSWIEQDGIARPAAVS